MAGTLTPISLDLLSDDMTVRTPIQGGYGGEYGEPVTVTNVRIEPVTAMERGNVHMSDATARVFVDAANSGNAFDIPAGSSVDIRGKSYTVISCSRFDGFDGQPHHWEVQLA